MRLGRRRAAARYLRTLAVIEALVERDQLSEVRRLLAGVDPLEARALARALETGEREGRGTGELSLLSSRTPW